MAFDKEARMRSWRESGRYEQPGWHNEQNGQDYGGRERHDGDQVRHGGGGNHGGCGGGHGGHGRDRDDHGRGYGGHRGNRGCNCRVRAQFLNDDELQTLSQNAPDEMLVFASQNEYLFLNTFKRKQYCKHPLKLKQMIKLLCLLVRSEDKRFAAAILAQILCPDSDYAGFMQAVDLLLQKMHLEYKDFIKKGNVTCIDHLIEIGLMAIRAIPTTVLYTFPIPVLQKTIDNLNRLGQNLVDVASKLEGLRAAFEEQWEIETEMRRKIGPSAEVGEPPEPFTELPILPTLEELSMKSSQVYLRSNIIAGGYKNWEHYFDIQFRLLREDFVRPLREGIELYCVTGSSHGISDILVYETRILNPICLYTGMGFHVRFDVSKLQNVKWEHSKRLIFGSLLCLSDDEFREHILFATVVKRDPKLLNEGLLTIKFEDSANGFAINPMTSFKMVESTAYFEAYRYILEALQNLSRNPDLMPMKSYIVDCVNYQDILRVPGFLDLPTSPAEFDMKDILNTRKPQFNVTDFTKWPRASQTGLDDSQLEALKMALTQELAVIQGPPGTGKTFMGLKIAETYLKNRHVWDPQRASPIFVVCYTNHALDQFLEGIQCIKGVEPEPNIIRIGGRSKKESLSHCLLHLTRLPILHSVNSS